MAEHGNAEVQVSVCVQTYQHVDYIRKCLDGILEQRTDFLFEIMLGEDASTDGTREICIEYAEKYPDKIQLTLHDRSNVIYIGGRPTGRYNFVTNLNNARGKYIAFCEGDDYWNDPTKLQKQFDFLEANPEYVFCYHNVRLATMGDELLDQWKIPPDLIGKGDQNTLLGRMRAPLLATMFRSEYVSLPPEFMQVFNADTFLLGLLSQHGLTACLDNIQDAVAHMHHGGIWTSMGEFQRFSNRIATFEGLLNAIDAKWHQEVERKIESVYDSHLLSCINSYSLLRYFGTLCRLRTFLKSRGRPAIPSVGKHLARSCLSAVRMLGKK